MKKIILTVTILMLAGLLFSCQDRQKEKVEAMNSGELEVFCDESYAFILDSVFTMYRQRYDKVELTVNFVNARNAKSKLFGGQTRAIIIGRDNLADEDSLMQLYNIPPYFEMEVANDALVFFTQPDFPLDTLNDVALLKVFTENENLKDIFPKLNKEPEFVIAHQNSSEYGNFMNLVCKRKSIKKPMLLLPNSDSVIKYVKNNPNAIGICYLSQIQGQFFKLLRIGYTDENGDYVKATKVPHQSFIVMGEYPYITLLRLYLLEEIKNLPYWFGTFVEKESPIVSYYQRMRLVPSYATYKLEDRRRQRNNRDR